MAKGNGNSRGNVATAENGAAARASLDPLLSAGHKALERWAAIGTELIQFGAARVGHGIELGRAIARSSSLDEALELQATFARSAVRDLLSEANKLTDISTQGLLEGFAELKKSSHGEIPPAEATQ